MNVDVLSPDKVSRIRELNDNFRRTFTGGSVYLTSSVAALEDRKKVRVLEAIRTFNNFTEANNPHGENDLMNVSVDGVSYLGKIDYLDISSQCHSEDPADPSRTRRVLVIMRADEY